MRIKRLLLLLLLALVVAAGSPTSAQKPALTPEQAISARRLRDLRWSPDGLRLAFSVAEPPKGADHTEHIWLYSANTGELRQFTNSSKTETHSRWSPDGKKLAFVSDREENKPIYVMPADGGEAVRLTEGKLSIEDFEWSPDGKRIAFLAKDAKTEAEEKKEKDKDDARSVDRDDRRTHLWIADAATGKVRALVGAPWSFSQVQWTPGGDRLVVIATDRPESDQETNRIFTVGVNDGRMEAIAAPRGPFTALRVSPDGKQIAYVGCRVDGPAPHDLFVQSLAGGPARNLTAASIDRPVEGLQWRVDGKLLLSVADGFRKKFYVVDTSGNAQLLIAPDMTVHSFSLSSSQAIAFSGENSDHPQELWLWGGQSGSKRTSRFNESFDNFAIAQPEFLRYKSFDGREIEAALLRPPGSESKKLPTVLIIHGGPTGNWEDEFEAWGQLLVGAGYAVFYPNIRGSTGYGYDFMVMNRADWGGSDFKDVMAGVDYLVAKGIADSDRLGIAGWSYGGYMAEWAITQTQRFKAAVSGAGMADLASEFGTEEHPAYDEWFYGLPYEKPEGFRRSSPITYIKNARTPTLILQGTDDLIDPLGQSQQLYRALKRYEVPAELVVYPREGHGLKEEKHLLDRLRRIVAWFDKYMK